MVKSGPFNYARTVIRLSWPLYGFQAIPVDTESYNSPVQLHLIVFNSRKDCLDISTYATSSSIIYTFPNHKQNPYSGKMPCIICPEYTM